MAYNYLRQPTMGYQGGGAVPGMQPLDIRREGDRMLDVSNLMSYNTGWGGPVRTPIGPYSPEGYTERLGYNIDDYIASAEKSQGYGNDEIDTLIAYNKIKDLLKNTLGREAVVKTGVDTGNLHAGKVKFYSPYPQAQSVQGFQGGGRAGTAFGLQTAGIETQKDLEKQAEEQATGQSKSSMWGNILGIGAGLAGSYLLPGVGGPFASKLFGKALSYALPKALTKAGVTAAYTPETYESKTGFGLDKYRQLSDRGEKFKSRGYEAAGTGFLTDVATAMMPSPITGKPAGSFGQQLGVEPAQWGAQLQNQIPISASSYQNFGQNQYPGFQLGTDFSFQGGGRVPNYYGR